MKRRLLNPFLRLLASQDIDNSHAAIGADVAKSVENMCHVVDGEVLWLIALVNVPAGW
jgi:hypothetical protein